MKAITQNPKSFQIFQVKPKFPQLSLCIVNKICESATSGPPEINTNDFPVVLENGRGGITNPSVSHLDQYSGGEEQ